MHYKYEVLESRFSIKGQSKYYIAEKDGEIAIFDRNGNRISDWFDYICPDGLVKGESDYYIAFKDDKFAVYYKSGKKVSGDFSKEYFPYIDGKITFDENLGIVEIKMLGGLTKETIEFNPFIKEEIIDYTKLLNI